MSKPRYTTEEIHDLIKEIEDKGQSYSEEDNVVREALNSFVLNDDEDRTFEAYEDVAAEASNLEYRAKALRSFVRAFREPIRGMGLKINHDNVIMSSIAAWRLRIGR